MPHVADRIRTRIAPALLTAVGVVFLAAGLLSVTNPVTADPTDAVASPTPSEQAVTSATPSPSPTPTLSLITLPPLGSGGIPSATPGFPADRHATRVRIAALKIDLPVIIPPTATYPACNVAMYFESPRLGQPGQGRATYIYAHARTGMFLPLLTASKVSNGKKMIGMVVELWTSDDQRFLYVINEVRRHVPFDEALTPAFAVDTDQLWLQTSEGVGIQPKLQVIADPLSQEAADHATANPVAKPVNCR